MDTYAICNRHRDPLITTALRRHREPYTLIDTPDVDLPPGWEPDPECKPLLPQHDYRFFATRHYRCVYGHQLAARQIADGHEPALVLEDDANPNEPDWLDVCRDAVALLDRFEVVSLHTRTARTEHWAFEQWRDRELWVYAGGGSLCGSLAYLIAPATARKIAAIRYVGKPMDVMLEHLHCYGEDGAWLGGRAGRRFAAVMPSPFDHDRSQGSLMERRSRRCNG